MKINKLFNDVTSKVTNFIDDKKKERELYNQVLNSSLVFKLDYNITKDKVITSANYKEYMDMCNYISYEEASKIDYVIAVNETVINVFYITQKVDNQIFVMVLTNFRIFIMNEDKYTVYNYQDITKIERISSNLFTQVINFNGIILGIDVDTNDLNVFYNLIVNTNYRNSIIMEKTKYLCGINPIYQKLNKIQSGISIDSNKNIVFHDRKINNYLCKYDDIVNYELLEDNTPVLKRKTNDQDTSMKFAKKECNQISLRVTLNNEQVFEIIVLEPKIFNDTYRHEETTYIKYFEFGKELMDKLDSMNEK